MEWGLRLYNWLFLYIKIGNSCVRKNMLNWILNPSRNSGFFSLYISSLPWKCLDCEHDWTAKQKKNGFKKCVHTKWELRNKKRHENITESKQVKSTINVEKKKPFKKINSLLQLQNRQPAIDPFSFFFFGNFTIKIANSAINQSSFKYYIHKTCVDNVLFILLLIQHWVNLKRVKFEE